jgi:hypothetical protein
VRLFAEYDDALPNHHKYAATLTSFAAMGRMLLINAPVSVADPARQAVDLR